MADIGSSAEMGFQLDMINRSLSSIALTCLSIRPYWVNFRNTVIFSCRVDKRNR